MYEKEIDFGRKTLTELFEILNLAQRYQVDELKEMVSMHNAHQQLPNLPGECGHGRCYC